MSTPMLITIVLLAASFSTSAFLAAARRRQEAANPRPPQPRQEVLEAVGASPAVATYLAQGDKISAIKAYRDETRLGLRDAKAAVDQMVSRIRARDLAAAGASERVASLLASGDTIGAIKAYREETGLELRDAKERIEALLQA